VVGFLILTVLRAFGIGGGHGGEHAEEAVTELADKAAAEATNKGGEHPDQAAAANSPNR
jgi:uncharacterized protein